MTEDELLSELSEFDEDDFNYFDNYYDNNAYEYAYQYYDGESFTNSLSGSARSCTNVIPVLFKKLCVHYNDNDGFKFTFNAHDIDNMDNNLLWYYGNQNDAFKAAQDAQNMFNNLESTELSFDKDEDWDNVDLVQNFLTKMLDNDALYSNLVDTYHKYGTYHNKYIFYMICCISSSIP